MGRRILSRNELVTVEIAGVLHPARVKKPGRTTRVQYVVETSVQHPEPWYSSNLSYYTCTTHNYYIRLRDEGNTWARGWDGEAVEALRAAVALA